MGDGDVGFEPRPCAPRGQTAGRGGQRGSEAPWLTCLSCVVPICKADLMHGLAALDL